jgi:hypothetical protein
LSHFLSLPPSLLPYLSLSLCFLISLFPSVSFPPTEDSLSLPGRWLSLSPALKWCNCF